MIQHKNETFVNILPLIYNTFAYLIIFEITIYLEISDIKSESQKKTEK